MKANKLLAKVILGGMIFLASFGWFKYQSTPAKVEQRIGQQIEDNRDEVDLKKIELEKNIKNAQNFVESMNNRIELKLTTLEGSYRGAFDKDTKQNKFMEWCSDSKLVLDLQYHASLDIPTDLIELSIDKYGNVMVQYRESDIRCNGISVDKHSYTLDRQLFGTNYTNEQLLSCIELSSDRIVDDINSGVEYRLKAEANLQTYLKDMARQFGVKRIIINNSYVETLNVEVQQVF